MPRIIYRHQPASRFIVSAIGEPGQREFFMQVKSENNFNTVAIDKGQVIALAERFEELIRELRRGKLATPEDLTAPAVQDDELLIDDIDYGPDLIVANLKINQIKGFCDRANNVVNAGRPACPFCALPVDPLGHLCPRANGYRR